MSYLVGPASITVGGSSLGNTFGGVEFNLVVQRIEEVGLASEVITDEVPLCGKGLIRKAEIDSVAVSSSNVRNDWSEVVFTGPHYRLTLYSCKIFYPKKMVFGKSDQSSFDLEFICQPDGSGNIYLLEEI